MARYLASFDGAMELLDFGHYLVEQGLLLETETDMCIDASIDTCLYTRIDMYIDMCIDMCLDMCTDMSRTCA